MKSEQKSEKPTLAAPGAGLPWLEAFLMRYYYMPKYLKKLSWEKFENLFLKEGEKIIALASPLSVEQLSTPVLIKRISGIEDSSRFWSVAMTLEHLMIVGSQMSKVVTALNSGKEPPGKASTAAVKPAGKAHPETIREEYKKFLGEFHERMKLEEKRQDLNVRFDHPWFGKMNSFQWHGVAAMHQNIHRRQVEAIIDGLASEKTG